MFRTHGPLTDLHTRWHSYSCSTKRSTYKNLWRVAYKKAASLSFTSTVIYAYHEPVWPVIYYTSPWWRILLKEEDLATRWFLKLYTAVLSLIIYHYFVNYQGWGISFNLRGLSDHEILGTFVFHDSFSGRRRTVSCLSEICMRSLKFSLLVIWFTFAVFKLLMGSKKRQVLMMKLS